MLFNNCIIFNFFIPSRSCNFNRTQTEKPSLSLFCSKCHWLPFGLLYPADSPEAGTWHT